MGLYKKKPTLAELYSANSGLFINLVIPSGLDRTVLQALILRELGDLQTIFETAEPCVIYMGIWSTIHKAAWQRMYDTLMEDYDPLHNYDRTDTETETVAGAETETETVGESENINDVQNSSFTGTTQAGGQDTVTRNRQGFNSSAFVPADQDITALGAKNDSTSATTGSGTQQRGLDRNENRKRDNNETRARTLTSAGNIGVTTSQQMLSAELEIRRKWTIYGIILEDFKNELCVGVW